MALGGLLVLLLVLVAVVLGVIAVVRRVLKKQEATTPTDGNDVVAYLVLALAMGVTGFALTRLAASAFPSAGIVLDPARDLASSLPALIVASPFAVYFWRRQTRRRDDYPNSVGWGVYLALIQLTFGIAFVTTAVIFLTGLFGDDRVDWTGAAVFGALLVFHELAARRTRPFGDAGEVYRVIASGIGLLTTGIGLVGTLGAGVFTAALDSIGSSFSGTPEWQPWIGMTIVGLPFWLYYWFRPWGESPGLPRQAWTVTVAAGTMIMTLVGVTGTLVFVAQQLIEDRVQDSEIVPLFLATALVGVGLWIVHRRPMGSTRNNEIRTYESVVASFALVSLVGSGVTLSQLAFADRTIVGGDASDVVLVAIWALISAGSWLWFHRRANTGAPEVEATAWPRRLYLLGIGAIMGITSAIALIAVLVVIIRRVLDGIGEGSVVVPATTFVLAGLASWYLLNLYARGQRYVEREEVVKPFDVTIVCGHPGRVGTLFPDQARLRVIHRGDGLGVIDDELAAEIVAKVGNQSSLVWVDADGVRVAPAATN